MNDEHHCRDCCCARSWKALGITGYTGKSIPEHITELRRDYDRVKGALAAALDWQQKVRDAVNGPVHEAMRAEGAR